MLIDSSALIAIVFAEPERERLQAALSAAERAVLSAASYLETGIVVDATGVPEFAGRLDQLLSAHGVIIAPVSPAQAVAARHAHRIFGRGSGHRARLDFGDCFAYALAIETDEPLLFKGDDFLHTDVRQASW